MVLSAAALDSDPQGLAYVSHVLRAQHESHVSAVLRASVGFSLTTLIVIGAMIGIALA
jgi:hypothetical protein